MCILKGLHKGVLIINFLIFTVFVLQSCCEPQLETESIAEERNICNVTMSILFDKTIHTETFNDIKYWEFMATPKFGLKPGDGEIVGTVSYWRRLNELTTTESGKIKSTASIGRYMSGDWYFEIRALNSNGHVLYLGQTNAYIHSGVDNLIDVKVYPDSADGTHGESADESSRLTGVTDKSVGQITTVRYGNLHVGFLTNKVEEDIEDMRITVFSQKMEKRTGVLSDITELKMNWTKRDEGEKLSLWYEKSQRNDTFYEGEGNTPVPQGKAYFEGICELDAGVYFITYKLEIKNKQNKWVILGGQSLNTVVVGGEESITKGYITAGNYIVAGIKISVPGSMYGTINGTGSVVSIGGASVNLTWEQDPSSSSSSNERPVSYEWYFEGKKLQSNENSVRIDCPVDDEGNPIYGAYRVSVKPIGSAGSKGHSDIDVVFNPVE